MEGTILSWLKKEGDHIDQDESVLEVATDKVDTEVPSTHSGILKEILAKEGEVVEVGKPIAIITVKEEKNNEENMATASEGEELKYVEEAVAAEAVNVDNFVKLDKPASNRFYSPLVRSIAKQENISIEELDFIAGTGKEGRVTKRDILAYIASGQSGTSQPTYVGSRQQENGTVATSGEDEIIEMDRMRKMIAQRMLDSRRISAHVTSFVEADVTNIVGWRNKIKHAFKERTGDTLTLTPLFIEAVVKALKDFPMMNISVDGDRIIKKKSINIGMAVALPSGNLIVPVIKNADLLSLGGLTKKVNELAKKSRSNQLTADDLIGGTFTISNVGSFGNIMGTPIIVQPQVGIIALGTVVKKPAVVETPSGDAIAIRHKMFLSHSYDHRVVDGALGGMFVRRVADYLERFDIKQDI